MEKMSDVGLVAQLVAVGDTHPRCGLSYRLPIFQNLYFIVTEEPLSSPTFGVLIRPLCCVSLTHGRGRLHLATYTYTPCIQTIVKYVIHWTRLWLLSATTSYSICLFSEIGFIHNRKEKSIMIYFLGGLPVAV